MVKREMLQVHINPMQVSSISAFTNVNGRLTNGEKDVYFVRYIGYEDKDRYAAQIREMDEALSRREQSGQGGYLREERLEARLDPPTAEKYARIYDGWRERRASQEPPAPELDFRFFEESTARAAASGVEKAMELYRRSAPGISDSMVRNFGIKLLYWLDRYLPRLYEGLNAAKFPKFVLSGDIKLQEYLFLYVLVCLGCDVLYLNPKGDLSLAKDVLVLSWGFSEKERGEVEIPKYEKAGQRKESPDRGSLSSGGNSRISAAACGGVRAGENAGFGGNVSSGGAPRPESGESRGPEAEAGNRPVIVSIPPRAGRSKTSRPAAPQGQNSAGQNSGGAGRPASGQNPGSRPASAGSGQRRELNYEELAALSPGVVMISVYNKNRECFKTGSGVVISEKGYILTNFHVTYEGSIFGVRFEDEERVYETDELIKYNHFNDLAVIKIDRRCKPIPLYNGEKELVRGQKVVAIGSPLGLFNSISDGIISGFRVINDVPMIQFTAPISHGSSGGALLNLYGELIGINTAGFDDGQNINLAVDYKNVKSFAGGFL